MSQAIPGKYPETGLNLLAEKAEGLTPEQWPEAVEYVATTVRKNRETAIDGIEPIPLSERQQFIIDNLIKPAVADTFSDIFGTYLIGSVPDENFVSLLTTEDFNAYYGTTAKPAAGVYFSERNQIIIKQGDHTSDSPEDLAYFTKVYTHEYMHYLSHQFSRLHRQHQYLQIERVGFHALGEDIREGREGELTWDYYLASNEAFTEMLAQEVMSKIGGDTVFKGADGESVGFHTTYADYRQLINRVLDDAVRRGATNMPKAELWHSACRGFLTGELKPLIELVHATYPGLGMKEFGLMTSVDDLPTDKDFEWKPGDDGDDGDWTLSADYLTRLRSRLNGKTPDDYKTDVHMPPPPKRPPSSSAMVFVNQIRQHQQNKLALLGLSMTENGKIVDTVNIITDRDEHFLKIHYDEAWLSDMLDILITATSRFRSGEITEPEASEIIDKALFEDRHISELSTGFESFYVAKHVLLDSSTSQEDFDATITASQRKLASLRQRN